MAVSRQAAVGNCTALRLQDFVEGLITNACVWTRPRPRCRRPSNHAGRDTAANAAEDTPPPIPLLPATALHEGARPKKPNPGLVDPPPRPRASGEAGPRPRASGEARPPVLRRSAEEAVVGMLAAMASRPQDAAGPPVLCSTGASMMQPTTVLPRMLQTVPSRRPSRVLLPPPWADSWAGEMASMVFSAMVEPARRSQPWR